MKTLLSRHGWLALVMVAGCASPEARARNATRDAGPGARPRADAEYTTAGLVPGSHEDWCEEHQVPETQCTRCDPSLIPAFQAVNDWDTEHGLPLSQCTIHDPNLRIMRPPKPEGR